MGVERPRPNNVAMWDHNVGDVSRLQGTMCLCMYIPEPVVVIKRTINRSS